jgi:hypothetical protein
MINIALPIGLLGIYAAAALLVWLGELCRELIKAALPERAQSEVASETVTTTFTVNTRQSVLVEGLKISYIRLCNSNTVRISIEAGEEVEIVKAEKATDKPIGDADLYEKDLAFWKREIKEIERRKKLRQALLLPKIDEQLVENNIPIQEVAAKFQVTERFVNKRYNILKKAGSFTPPLFEIE